MPRGIRLLKWLSPINQKYNDHKDSAKRRGIPFLLTFDEWYQTWLDSGHWDERGCGKGKYCMARPGDIGAYTIGNVKIIKIEENSVEGNLPGHHELRRGWKHTDQAKVKQSAKASERRWPEAHKEKIRATLKANEKHCKQATERILAEVKKQVGVPRTEKDKQKMRDGWALRKTAPQPQQIEIRD